MSGLYIRDHRNEAQTHNLWEHEVPSKILDLSFSFAFCVLVTPTFLHDVNYLGKHTRNLMKYKKKKSKKEACN